MISKCIPRKTWLGASVVAFVVGCFAGASPKRVAAHGLPPMKATRQKQKPNPQKTTRKAKAMFVYIGTYTGGDSKGIYVYRLDNATGKLDFTGQSAMTTNPSFLAFSPNGRNLYAANEVGEVSQDSGAGVSSFAIDAKSGALKWLNWQSSRGGGTCFVAVSPLGNLVAAANYNDGSVAAFRVLDDGSLAAATFFEKFSAPPKASHAHSFNFDASGRFAFASDLGFDRIVAYKIDQKKAQITPNIPPFLAMRAASGPRHFVFHSSQRFAYSINELDSTISLLKYDAKNGTLQEVEHVSTLPPDFKGENSCAEVQISPDGRFLYASNRGHDSLAIFRIDDKSGHLTFVAHTPTQGKAPRNFALDPSGDFVIVANQNSNNLVVFRRDAQNGTLAPTGQIVEIPVPVCVVFGHAAH